MSGGWDRDVIDYGGGPGMSGGGRGGGSAGADGRIYVGNLPPDVREKDLEELFYKYGRIRDIELKSKRGLVPFAFVRFEDPRCVRGAAFPALRGWPRPRLAELPAAGLRERGRVGGRPPLGPGCAAHPPQPAGRMGWGGGGRPSGAAAGSSGPRVKPRTRVGRQPWN